MVSMNHYNVFHHLRMFYLSFILPAECVAACLTRQHGPLVVRRTFHNTTNLLCTQTRTTQLYIVHRVGTQTINMYVISRLEIKFNLVYYT